jgi:hypothetical protein
MPRPVLLSVHPRHAIAGARISIRGTDFYVDGATLPGLRVGGQSARVVFASRDRFDVLVPPGAGETGPAFIEMDGSSDRVALAVAVPVATGLHQVDSPVIDREGNLFVTYSGTRGQQVPVSIFRIKANGTRESYSSGIVNPTSMAIDREGNLFVSSRFEGTVYRVSADGTAEAFATDLGIACGLAFAPDGTLFVGDRSGTIFSIDRFGRATPLATLPPSVAAYHIALGSDALYVAGPTLAPSDVIYRVGFDGRVAVHSRAFGRPQGLALNAEGSLFVVEALAGASGLYRIDEDGTPSLVLAGTGLIGVAFDRAGGMAVCTNDTAYRVARFS